MSKERPNSLKDYVQIIEVKSLYYFDLYIIYNNENLYRYLIQFSGTMSSMNIKNSSKFIFPS